MLLRIWYLTIFPKSCQMLPSKKCSAVLLLGIGFSCFSVPIAFSVGFWSSLCQCFHVLIVCCFHEFCSNPSFLRAGTVFAHLWAQSLLYCQNKQNLGQAKGDMQPLDPISAGPSSLSLSAMFMKWSGTGWWQVPPRAGLRTLTRPECTLMCSSVTLSIS